MAHEDEYSEAMMITLDLVWGEGFMAPGGEGNVDNLVRDLDIRDKRVLDIGCGQGRPACILAQKYGAQVVGTDLEGHLIERANRRAAAAGLASRTEFLQVEPGPLDFPDESFDVIVSSGAFTQIEDKLGMFRECYRVLKPGGTLSIYDWMKSPGEYSEDMLYWFKMEGLTYAMRTPEEHLALLDEAGFQRVTSNDRSGWYRRQARLEYERMCGELNEEIHRLLGKADAEHFIEDWRAMVVVCESGEMLQVYTRGFKP